MDENCTQRSLRSAFIEHVKTKGVNEIICIRAETAALELLSQIEEHRRENLSEFEGFIASIVSSVLIFPESPGSFAELGFFSAHIDISEKTIISVKEMYQDNSFISLGPIHFVSSVSNYRPLPLVIGDNLDKGFDQIVDRLIGGRKRKNRTRFQKMEWKGYSKKQQLSILDEIIEVVGVLTEPDLKNVIFDAFGAYKIDEIRMLLSLLVAMNRIKIDADGDIYSAGYGSPLMVCNEDYQVGLKAMWLEAYRASQPDVLARIGVGRE